MCVAATYIPILLSTVILCKSKVIYLMSITQRKLAQSSEPEADDKVQTELEFKKVGFWGGGKSEYLEKNLSEQGQEPTTN